MSRFSPAGPRTRCARFLSGVVIGGLCLALPACDEKRAGYGAGTKETTDGDAATASPPPSPPQMGTPPKASSTEKQGPSNQEDYAPIVENAFRSPLVEPRSTFSADVNTASYSNVRRFLTGGHLPPRDAVFLAELVNYFPYRYPNPPADVPASMTVDLARCPWKPDHYLARIGVRARSYEPGESPARNLVFLVDVSGSMADQNKLPLVKRSLELLVERLTPRDRVSIVTYAGDAGIRLRPTPGDERDAILHAVRSLKAGGSTNGEGGIKLAYRVARESFVGNGVNRVVLCTDGDFNVGNTSDSEVVRLIERERHSQVFLTVLGYGMGNYKNQKMELLANHGNGHHAYVDSLDEARKVFVEQGGALAVVAKDVKFQVEFNPKHVAAYRLLGYENRILASEDFKNDARDAGDMGSGHTVTALYEIVPAGVPIDLPGVDPLRYQAAKESAGSSDEWLTVKMRYKPPAEDKSKEQPPVVLTRDAVQPMSEDFAFASAVAEWGLVLRNSEHRGSANLTAALKRAESASSYDPNGHRAEFLRLLHKTIELSAKEERPRLGVE